MSMEDKTKVVKKYVCSTCHGTGQVTCSKCGGKGERKCPHCDGTGHACPVCSRGYVKKKRLVNCSHCYGKGYTIDQIGGKYRCYDCGGRGQIEETYKEICPNCHGDYKNTDHVCDKCDGHKKISCAKRETCPSCGGKGRWSEVYDKKSKSDLRVFRGFSMAFGFSGLQFAYVGRWWLFGFQFATFIAFVFVALFSDQIASFVAQFCAETDYSRWIASAKDVLGTCWAVNMLIGLICMFKMKRDGQGGELQDDYKRGWFWVFFLLFGVTGAHLAYTKERLLLGVHLVWITVPTVKMLIAKAGGGIDDIITVLSAGIGATIIEACVAVAVNFIFNTSFLDHDK